MLRRGAFTLFVAAHLVGCPAAATPPAAVPQPAQPVVASTELASEELADSLASIRKESGVPALAAAVFGSAGITELAAVGVRKAGDATPVTVEDRFHLGSCTKAMTATVAARLVARSLLGWETTMAEGFPDLGEAIHPGYRATTLLDLLSHRAGAWSAGKPQVLSELRNDDHPLVEQRAALARRILADAPEELGPGEYRYSNYGYVLAGALLERASGKPFEALLADELFTPLGMASCGFGAPARAGQIDEPYGHLRRLAGLRPVEPGPDGDNPLALGPAGTVHCSLRDWVKFLTVHLRGARGEGTTYLGADAFEVLHAPRADKPQPYALGWIVAKPKFAGGERVLTHTGSNTMFIAQVWLSPTQDLGVAVVTNSADEHAKEAIDAVVRAAIVRLVGDR
jgi:D-alanyl-D-alanine carboxypeptidase